MSEHEVEHACGHPYIHQIVGKTPRLAAWIAKRRAQSPCPDCKTRQWQTQAQVDNATHATTAQHRQWPALVGTERQAQWATTLRGQFIDELPGKAAELNRHADLRGHAGLQHIGEALSLISELVLKQTDAAWWIENRSLLGDRLCLRYRVELAAAGEVGITARMILKWAGGTR